MLCSKPKVTTHQVRKSATIRAKRTGLETTTFRSMSGGLKVFLGAKLFLTRPLPSRTEDVARVAHQVVAHDVALHTRLGGAKDVAVCIAIHHIEEALLQYPGM